MRFLRLIGVTLLEFVEPSLPQPAAAMSSDSIYSQATLSASTAPPWSPPAPVSSARGWESALRFPGRIVSLPFVAIGSLAERYLIRQEHHESGEREHDFAARAAALGITVLPASLGAHSGLGGGIAWVPPGLGRRLSFESTVTSRQYNRQRVRAAIGGLNAAYISEWRPRDVFFGTGLAAPRSGESAYGEHTRTVKLLAAWGWQSFDTVAVQPSDALMFRDRVRVRGPKHRTWVSAWAGPRARSVTRGRDPDRPSFELVHPAEAAGSLYRSVEHFTYGAGLSHDARRGRPHWSNGWRASVEADRYDKSIQALALHDAHTDARSFTRMTYRAEAGSSFGRDPRTFRLALTAVDQTLDASNGTFLVGDLQSLGGSAGIAGYQSGRFRDHDLIHARLSYIYPLVKNLEVDLHTETGGVYPGLSSARLSALKSSFGTALRIRSTTRMLGAIGCDWSSEQARIWLAVGGVE